MSQLDYIQNNEELKSHMEKCIDMEINNYRTVKALALPEPNIKSLRSLDFFKDLQSHEHQFIAD